ncbi:MAG: hypothetical protein K2P58_14325 [Hyphomonadaceae bacterium]|nr:hypothetical protein [Hyphomonadaceae bacterium]
MGVCWRAIGAAVLLWGCAEQPPNPYPETARVQFESTCPASDPRCSCTWDKITRMLTYEEYEAAVARFNESGQMDTRITRARTQCLERREE